MIETQESEECYSIEQPNNQINVNAVNYSILQPSTVNNLLVDHRSLNNYIDYISVSNYVPHTSFRQPIICLAPQRLGFFSIRSHPFGPDTYHPDKSSLCRLRPNYSHFTNITLKDFVYIPEMYHIPVDNGHILKWIHSSTNRDFLANINFVCTSLRVLRSILNVPYNQGVYWSTLAIKIGSVIYLTSPDPNAPSDRPFKLKAEKVQCTFVGQKFADLITIKKKRTKRYERSQPFTGKTDSFYTVNQFSVGQHKILYPFRADCTLDYFQFKKPLEQMQFAQIRYRPIKWPVTREQECELLKSITWWMGSFLGQAETIIYGEKKRGLEIREIKTIKADSLLQLEGNIPWDPLTCFDHLEKILNTINSIINVEKAVYHFRWDREDQMIKWNKGKEPYKEYIPDWYMDVHSAPEPF